MPNDRPDDTPRPTRGARMCHGSDHEARLCAGKGRGKGECGNPTNNAVRTLHDPQSSSHSATTVSKSPIWNAERTLLNTIRAVVESVSDP
ncbi:hypothetical protein SISSUDRAFT_1054306 [Sistotremastrum suecicum HHB10207 ss-3]|uniref:Uncharacterized protein n=1 Tax=Sistotremastrum suecicum HHB10207 ss-3 TaxID=1314776 RepID=A0A165YLB7_9AGAM|nr:hypothetical protein SISSUDRAFT_1054306 [Sistotremastrum suecicum HHB10207 ss-3]